MALDTIVARLMALEVFRGLDTVRLERLAREADRIIFRDGQQIVEAGAVADGATVIVSGRAAIITEGEASQEPEPVEAGTMLCELAMLTEHTPTITVVAAGDVRAIRITRAALAELMEEDPSLAGHFHDRLLQRLQRVAVELRLIDERLAAATEAAEAARDAA